MLSIVKRQELAGMRWRERVHAGWLGATLTVRGWINPRAQFGRQTLQPRGSEGRLGVVADMEVRQLHFKADGVEGKEAPYVPVLWRRKHRLWVKDTGVAYLAYWN